MWIKIYWLFKSTGLSVSSSPSWQYEWDYVGGLRCSWCQVILNCPFWGRVAVSFNPLTEQSLTAWSCCMIILDALLLNCLNPSSTSDNPPLIQCHKTHLIFSCNASYPVTWSHDISFRLLRLISSVCRTMLSLIIFRTISNRLVSSEQLRRSSQFVLVSLDGRQTIFWGRFYSMEFRPVCSWTSDDRRDKRCQPWE